MSEENEAERLARAWIDGWNAGKPDQIPLAAEFVHSSPFGTVAGRDKYLEWVKPRPENSWNSAIIVIATC